MAGRPGGGGAAKGLAAWKPAPPEPASDRWSVLVATLSSDNAVVSLQEANRKRRIVDRHVRFLRESCPCDVVEWPPQHEPEGASKRQHWMWHSLLQTLRDSRAHILVLVSDGVCDGNLYFRDDKRVAEEDEARWYRKRGEALALEIVTKFKRDKRFQVIVLAGVGTARIGARIDEKFRSLPLLLPPSIICWDDTGPGTQRMDALAGVCAVTQDFLHNTLKDRLPRVQQDLDLRGTMHSFIALKRENKGSDKPYHEAVTYLPRSQIDFIGHIYYRLGLGAFELGRRIERIINHGLMRDFALSSPSTASSGRAPPQGFSANADADADADAGADAGAALPKREYSRVSTVFLFAELFGWLYVLRQQPAQLLYQKPIRDLEWSFSGCVSGAQIPTPNWRLGDVKKGDFQLLKFDVRSMGEAMVIKDGTIFRVLTWVEFRHRWPDASFRSAFRKIENNLQTLEELKRDKGGVTEVLYLEHEIDVGDAANPRRRTFRVLQTNYRARLAWIMNQLFAIVEHYTTELITSRSSAKVKPVYTTAREELQRQVQAHLRSLKPSAARPGLSVLATRAATYLFDQADLGALSAKAAALLCDNAAAAGLVAGAAVAVAAEVVRSAGSSVRGTT